MFKAVNNTASFLKKLPDSLCVYPLNKTIYLRVFLLITVLSGFISINTAEAQISFSSAGVKGTNLINPTSLEFGPDGRLYVSQQDGLIKVFTVQKDTDTSYAVTSSESITLVKNIPNHNDDGTLNTSITSRQVTGILVRGTRTNPVIYVTSSDPRIGGGGSGASKNLDTNSGTISKLTWDGTKWVKMDLVRGLPRSEENHATNGLQLDEANNILYVAQGGHTNAGAPSNNFAFHTEYALAAAILSVDLNIIEALPTQGSGNNQYKYDLPTLDDPNRANSSAGIDLNDPFGGNKGLNQAKIVEGGPVQVYAPGFRNVYDLVISKTPGKAGRMYTWDNGANSGWGGYPENEGTPSGSPLVSNVTNNYVTGEPGSNSPGQSGELQVNNKDGLHFVREKGYYGGHPTPIRANPAGAGLYTRIGTTSTFRTRPEDLPQDWPPVPVSMANPREGDYLAPGSTASPTILTRTSKSINGLAEYTASNFSGAIQGNLVAASYNDKVLVMVELNSTGDKVVKEWNLAANFGSLPLDVTTQGDNAVFPGTIWAATYGTDEITVFEPQDVQACSRTYDNNMDEDGDRYNNADEIDNGTDPCSSASKPLDFDGDFTSDLNDADDDNDGIADLTDLFQWDRNNGKGTGLPITYDLLNGEPGFGFFGQGFTGVMSNGTKDYMKMFSQENMIAGGAVGLLTIKNVNTGDAYGGTNSQDYGFQFGVDVSSATGPFTVESRLLGPYFNDQTPTNYQSQGFYIGTGDQNNYLKIVLNANGGVGGFQVLYESGGAIVSNQQFAAPGYKTTSYIDIYLSIDPIGGKVQPKYKMEGGTLTNLGNPISLTGSVLTAVQSTPALAVGIISTAAGSGTPFLATWDRIYVTQDATTSTGSWQLVNSSDASAPTHRHENAYVQVGDKFYLLGGRGIKPVQIWDPATKKWTSGALTPVEMHHFQAVNYKGLIYVIGAFTGNYPSETPLANIYIYDPVKNKWYTGPEIPQARRRGSAGAVVYNDKIYLLSGLTNGHTSGHVTWLDEFDPATNTWKVLPNAPRARDHYHAAVVGSKLFAASGRNSSYPDTWGPVVAEVDVFNFSTNTWSTLPSTSNIPTKRAGAAAAVLGNEILYIGGESMAQTAAHNQTEALDASTGAWRTLAPLKTGRHGTQAIVSNGGVYVAAGSTIRGNSETNTQEAFYLFSPTTPTGIALSQGALNAPASVDVGAPATGSTATKSITLNNPNGNQAIVITSLVISGSSEFKVTSPYSLPVTIAPGQSINLTAQFTPTSSGTKSATLTINNSGANSATSIALTGGSGGGTNPGGADPIFRINAGGAQISGTPIVWSANTTSSSYVNTSTTKYSTRTFTGTNNTGAPNEIFNTSRWDSGVPGDALTNEMRWTFPVQNGSYQVKLYFAETYSATMQVGGRIFDVFVEGQLSLNDLDIYGEAGPNALVKTVTASVNDGTLNIDFLHVKDNPQINGIEIIPASTAPTLSANTTNVHFFNQEVNTTSAPQAVTLTNTGTTSLQVSGITITGTNAAEFNHTFSTAVTLAAGASTSFNVTFSPKSLGTKVANLAVTHTGANSPFNIGLTGEASGTSTTQSVVSFTLINADTDKDIATLTDGYVINYAAIGTKNLNIRANTNPSKVGSVIFSLDGKLKTENVGPYALAGDNGNTTTTDYYALNPALTLGSHTLLATPYSSSNGGGTKGAAISVSFSVSDGTSGNSAPVVNAGTDKNLTLPTNSTTLSGSATDNDGTIASYSWTKQSGPSATISGANTATLSLSNLVEGTYVFRLTATDNAGATGFDEAIVTVTSSTSAGTAIRINAGGASFTTASGFTFEADKYFSGTTSTYTNNNISDIANTTDDALYKTERSAGTEGGAFTYSIPVANGNYTVKLHFAEIWFGATGGKPLEGQAGKRVFNVNIEGQPKLVSYDIISDVGSMAAAIKSFDVSVSDGYLTLDFASSINRAKISAIEVLPVVAPSPTTQSVVSFTLINADTDKDIATLTDGYVINYAAIGTKNLNIRANTNPSKVGSVIFSLDGKLKTENVGPYALAGDNGNTTTDYYALNPVLALGNHTLIATPYSSSNGGGTKGTALTVSFSVTEGTSASASINNISKEQENIDEISLDAYPNPFSGMVSLKVVSPKNEKITLEIYDLRGVLIKKVYDGIIETGNAHQFEFNGAGLPEGMYVGRLHVGKEIIYKKLILRR